MASRGRWLLGSSALLLLSCAKPSGTFTPDRFVHEEYSYEVRYLRETPDHLLGEAWRLDNYVWEEGVPKRQKTSEDYVVQRGYDLDDDGEIDSSGEEPYYDLLLEHRRKDAAIWVRTVPIASHDQQKELEVFADQYVEAASGSGTIVVPLGADRIGAVGKRFASRVLSRGACSVSGVPAYRVDFEVANVDQLQLTPDARWSSSRVVIVRTPFLHAAGFDPKGQERKVPVVMVVGLRASPRDFGELSQQLDLLLDRIVIANGTQALSRATPAEQTCRVEAPSPAAPAPSADAAALAPPPAPVATTGGIASTSGPELPAPTPPEVPPPALAPSASGARADSPGVPASGAPSAAPPPARKRAAPGDSSKRRSFGY